MNVAFIESVALVYLNFLLTVMESAKTQASGPAGLLKEEKKHPASLSQARICIFLIRGLDCQLWQCPQKLQSSAWKLFLKHLAFPQPAGFQYLFFLVPHSVSRISLLSMFGRRSTLTNIPSNG